MRPKQLLLKTTNAQKINKNGRGIYNVKAENQEVNIWFCVMTTHKEQSCKMLSLGLQIFTENLAGGLGLRREYCWGYVSVSVNASRKANFEIHLPCESCCNFT